MLQTTEAPIERDSNRNIKQNFKGCGAEIVPLPEGENI